MEMGTPPKTITQNLETKTQNHENKRRKLSSGSRRGYRVFLLVSITWNLTHPKAISQFVHFLKVLLVQLERLRRHVRDIFSLSLPGSIEDLTIFFIRNDMNGLTQPRKNVE